MRRAPKRFWMACVQRSIDVNKPLLLTRTEPGASYQAQLLRARGFQARVSPVLDILPLTPPLFSRRRKGGWVPADVSAAVAAPPKLVIVLSGHAARAGLRSGVLDGLGNALFVAVGSQTAQLLREAGRVVEVPLLESSEGVLQMPLIQTLLPADNVWVLAGTGGRTTLSERLLDEHGVSVLKVALYERVERKLAADVLPESIGGVVIGSVGGLSSFAGQWGASKGDKAVPIVVPSARVASAAARSGFTSVYTADGAGTVALVELLEDIAKNE